MRRLALPQMPAQGADFLLMDRKVVDAYNSIREKNTSFLAMILWLGFRQTFIEYVKQARHAGVSKWNLSKKIKLFIDSLVSFSYAPIRLMSAVGVGASLLGMLYAAVVVVNALRGDPVNGWSSIMVVVLLLGGFQMVMLGILGEYLWRAFDEARGGRGILSKRNWATCRNRTQRSVVPRNQRAAHAVSGLTETRGSKPLTACAGPFCRESPSQEFADVACLAPDSFRLSRPVPLLQCRGRPSRFDCQGRL